MHALPIEGALVVNIGDMLERWTAHRFKSTIHRVVNTSPCDRFSAPYFLEPNMESLIVPGGLGQGNNNLAGDIAQAKTAEEILGSFYRASGQLKDYAPYTDFAPHTDDGPVFGELPAPTAQSGYIISEA